MKTCNHGHIGIQWSASGDCPLCACYELQDRLYDALRDAAHYLGTLAVANSKNGFNDFVDVRGYASSRVKIIRELLKEEHEYEP